MDGLLHHHTAHDIVSQKSRVCVFSVALISFTLTTMGCDSDLPDISWEGEHIRFANGHDTPPCGNTLQRLDDMVGDLEEALELPLPEGTKITYYWLPSNEADKRCPGSNRSCSSEMVVISDDPIIPHELVHAVTHSLGTTHTFFNEGLAVAFGETPYQPPLIENLVDLVEPNLVPYLSKDKLDYRAAGFFVRYLTETYGITKTKKIVSLTNQGSDYQDIDGIFLHVLGVSLKLVLEDLASLSSADLTCYMSPPSCVQSTDLWFDTPQWEQVIQVECSGELTTGPFTGYVVDGVLFDIQEGELQIPVVFEISEAGTYWIDASESTISSGLGFVRPCFFEASCDWAYRVLSIGDFSTGNNSISAYFEPGNYQIDFHLYSEGMLNVLFEKME